MVRWPLIVWWPLIGVWYDGNRRASRLDIHFGPAWLGFGHSFAAEGEHDQANAAYSTAARLMSGCHLPLLYIGMECIATNNTSMARQYFVQAHEICDRDPLVLHELGVIAFRTGEFANAEKYFLKALDLNKPSPDESAPVQYAYTGYRLHWNANGLFASMHVHVHLCAGTGAGI